MERLGVVKSSYSICLISVLEPDAMYIFKNTGTLVIGVSESLTIEEFEEKSDRPREVRDVLEMASKPSGTVPDKHAFQIVSSDTTVFQDYTNAYYNI